MHQFNLSEVCKMNADAEEDNILDESNDSKASIDIDSYIDNFRIRLTDNNQIQKQSFSLNDSPNPPFLKA